MSDQDPGPTCTAHAEMSRALEMLDQFEHHLMTDPTRTANSLEWRLHHAHATLMLRDLMDTIAGTLLQIDYDR